MICKVCKNKNNKIFFNKNQCHPTGQYFVRPFKPKNKVKMQLYRCSKCNFIFKKKNKNFIINYTSVNRNTKNQLQPYYKNLIKSIITNSSKNDLILEIGSNDNTFLNNLFKFRKNLLGIEPSKYLSKKKKFKKLNVINNYFTKKMAQKILRDYTYPRIVFSRHTLEHIPDINDFIYGCKIIFNDKTIGFIEVPDTDWIYKNYFYHEIWDEHENYFTKDNLSLFLKLNNFKIIKTETKRFRDTRNLIIWFKKSLNKDLVDIKKNFVLEKKIFNSLKKWEENSKRLKIELSKSPKPIYAVGAGHNQLNFLNFSNTGKFINYLIDDDKFKQNKFVYIDNLIKIISLKKLKKSDFGTILFTCFPFPNLEKKIRKEFKKFKFIKAYS